MAMTLDTLAYTKELESAGISREHAEAHAKAARDFIMPELATKADIARLEHLIEAQTAKLTLRMGALLVVAVGALATILRLT